MKGLCIICSQEFKYYPSNQSGKYCSLPCAYKCKERYSKLKIIKKGDRHTLSELQKMSSSQKGKKLCDERPNWKGEDVGYTGLHHWVRYRLKQPDACPNCGKVTNLLDLANISQEYKRDLDDWEYLCRKCHQEKDGRLKKLKDGLNKLN